MDTIVIPKQRTHKIWIKEFANNKSASISLISGLNVKIIKEYLEYCLSKNRFDEYLKDMEKKRNSTEQSFKALTNTSVSSSHTISPPI